MAKDKEKPQETKKEKKPCVLSPGSLCISNAKLMRQALDNGDNARAYRLISAFIGEYEKRAEGLPASGGLKETRGKEE